jgi:hypothetical protein
MNRILLFLPILFLSSITVFSQEQMSAEKFNQIASTSGDNTPLSGKLAAFPFWTNSEVKPGWVHILTRKVLSEHGFTKLARCL